MKRLGTSASYKLVAFIVLLSLLGSPLFVSQASAAMPIEQSLSQIKNGNTPTEPNGSKKKVNPNSPVALPAGLTASKTAPASLAEFKNAKGIISVMVELEDEPAVFSYVAATEKQLDSNNTLLATRNQQTKIENAQQNVLNNLTSRNLAKSVIYRIKNVYNGIAIQTDAKNLEEISKLAGVKALHPITSRTRENASSVGLINAPVAWTSFGITGTNIKVGVIDTGIDYYHANFGGPGITFTTSTISNTVITDTPGLFPGPKVAGGIDLVGDAYNADPNSPSYNPVPAPDPDPVDCPAAQGGGHGSHVAGTVAGYGVNANGTTYTGPFNNTVPTTTMRIGPGVAPGAKLYAIRVFGCGGSTDVTSQAIDWAIDPNGDGNFSDHLDVINMSLGSDFGSVSPETDPDIVSSNNASLAGVVVVASAGNAGDTHYIHGSPAQASRAIGVASSVDALDVMDGFRVNSPVSISGVYTAFNSFAYNWETTPDITGTVYYPTSSPTDGCTTYSSADAAAISGKVVLIDWFLTGATASNCGSVARTNRIAAAGGIGVIMVYNSNNIDIAITGGQTIPAVISSKFAGDQIKSQIANNVSVTFSKQYTANVKNIQPGNIDTLSSFTSRGPAFGNKLKPDIAAPGQSIFSTLAGSGTKGESLNGTSMAAPHVAGVMALLKQRYPNWSTEELKALAMNTANNDLYTGSNKSGTKYSPSRVGSGRVDVAQAINNPVVAYVADADGAVNASFGLVDVLNGTSTTLTKTIRLVNKSNNAAQYTASISQVYTTPGVILSFPGGTNVNVPANGSVDVVLQAVADSSQLKNSYDPTMQRSITNLDRFLTTETQGLVLFTPATGSTLRVPFYGVIRKTGEMRSVTKVIQAPQTPVTTSINLTGTQVGLQGSRTPTETYGVGTYYELQGSFPPVTDTKLLAASLQYVGVATDSRYFSPATALANSQIFFGVSTYANWVYPTYPNVEVDVNIDTNNDGQPDYILYTTRVKNGGDDTDLMVSSLYNVAAGTSTVQKHLNGDELTPSFWDTNAFNSNVIALPLSASAVFTSGSNTRFKYWVETYYAPSYRLVSRTPIMTFDWKAPGMDASGGYSGIPYWDDVLTQDAPVYIDPTAFTANQSKGLLILHHHNKVTRGEAIPMCANAATQVTATSDDGTGTGCGTLSLALATATSANNTNPVTITVSVPGNVITTTGPIFIPAPAANKTITLDGGCTNNAPGVELRAASGVEVTNGIVVNGGTNVIRGFKLTGFKSYGLNVQAGDNTITCNQLTNNGGGIRLANANGSTTLGIAGQAGSGNVIYANNGYGISVESGVNNTAYYNWVGYTPAGAPARNQLTALKVWPGAKLKLGPFNRFLN